ncbi:MAG TPA: hypothetical protein VGD22_08705 [Sphingobacteriaceae bacterium]
MNLNDRDIDWEKDAPHIASAGRENPFVVPEGYFDTMREHVSARVAVEDMGKDLGLKVPKGYFNELPGLIEAKIAVEELKEELSSEGFKVPQGYFESLSDKIIERTQSEPKRQLFSIVPKWISYAAAACITGIIGISIWLNVNENSINNRLAKVPAGAIESYLNLYTDQTDVQVIEENMDTEKVFSGITNNISEQELEEFIEETTL